MRILPLIPLLFLTACSTNRAPRLVIRPQEPPPSLDESAVRYPEIIRAYHIGRYADPNNDLVLNEQHVIYRVEAGTRWNLHPGSDGFHQTPQFLALTNAAFAQAPVTDDVVAEVNRQKLMTLTITAEAARLTGSLRQLGVAIAETKAIARENHELRQQLSAALKRLDAVESELNKAQSIQTNSAPESALQP